MGPGRGDLWARHQRPAPRLEGRDGREVLYLAGQRVAVEGVEALYPAFDITPPHLISGIVTDRGVFPAHLIHHYWRGQEVSHGS